MIINSFQLYNPYKSNVVSFSAKKPEPNKTNEADVTFHVFKNKNGELIKEFPDKLDEYYGQRNIIVIGSAASTPQISKDLQELEKITEALTKRGYNIITGAGADGVMGAATTGVHNILLSGKGQIDYSGSSLCVLTQGGWGDEDLLRSTPISMAPSGKESERIEGIWIIPENLDIIQD